MAKEENAAPRTVRTGPPQPLQTTPAAPAARAAEPKPAPEPTPDELDAACLPWLRQAQARVVWFRRNDGTELVRASADGFGPFEAPRLHEATQALRERVERFANRKLQGGR